MGRPDIALLTPGDAAVALRSFPRRYRQVLLSSPEQPDVDPEERARHLGPDGLSAAEMLIDSINTLVVVEQSLTRMLREDQPTLHPAVISPTEREWQEPPGLSLDDLLGMLDDICADLADSMDRVATSDWWRTGRLPSGESFTALAAIREGVRTASDNLRRAETLLKLLRNRSD